MNPEPLRCVEIIDPLDPLLLPWLDLYETAFPPCERALVSELLRTLAQRAASIPTDRHFLAVLDEAGDLAGMACVVIPQGAVAWLWYLAVRPAGRGQGLGSAVYREIIQRVHAAGCPAMVFEVEIPDEARDAVRRQDAERRIRFYRRLGASLLGGIHYVQDVGWHQQPIPMHVMVHAFGPVDGARAFAIAQSVFGDAIRQVGTLRLNP